MTLAYEPWGADRYPPVYRAYCEDFPRLAHRFAYGPDDFAGRAAALDAAWHGDREGVAGALAAYQEAVGGDPAAAARLAEPRALAVVAGQQAGLFTGPLFSIYKAVSLLRLAAELQARLDRPVVPVYWVAGEDHDYNEIATAYAADDAGRLHRLTLPPPPGAGRCPVCELPVPAAARELAERLVALVPRPDPAARALLLAQLEASLAAGEDLSRWFARQLAALFGGRGLVLLDPTLPLLRHLALPVARRAWSLADELNARLAAAGDELAAAGFAAALAPEAGQTLLFYCNDARERLAVFRRGETAVDRAGRPLFAGDELERLADRLSYGVAARPVVETLLLPVLAHVSGPGEVAYLAQLREVFSLCGSELPLILPRLGLTLVGPEDRGLPLVPLWRDLRRAIDDALAGGAPFDLAARFAAERAAIEARYQALAADLGQLAPALPQLAAVNRRHVLHQLDYLEGKARQHLRRRHKDVARAYTAAAGRLFPRGGLQEHWLNVWPLLLRYGTAWLEELCASAPLAPGHHVARWTAD